MLLAWMAYSVLFGVLTYAAALAAERVSSTWSFPRRFIWIAALVATFNLMEKYFTLTRDYGIITDNPYHVAQIVEVFNADWEERDWNCGAYEGLLSSNSNSRYHVAQFIDTATERLDVQDPK